MTEYRCFKMAPDAPRGESVRSSARQGDVFGRGAWQLGSRGGVGMGPDESPIACGWHPWVQMLIGLLVSARWTRIQMPAPSTCVSEPMLLDASHHRIKRQVVDS